MNVVPTALNKLDCIQGQRGLHHWHPVSYPNHAFPSPLVDICSVAHPQMHCKCTPCASYSANIFQTPENTFFRRQYLTNIFSRAIGEGHWTLSLVELAKTQTWEKILHRLGRVFAFFCLKSLCRQLMISIISDHWPLNCIYILPSLFSKSSHAQQVQYHATLNYANKIQDIIQKVFGFWFQIHKAKI